MRIAFINIYQNRVNRGAETFVSELSKRLVKNHDIYILTSLKPLFKKRYDIVIPTNGRLQAMMVRIITFLTGSKMIVSGQSGAGLDDRINLYSFPDIFVGLTKYQSDWAKKINPFVKIETIPNGVDMNRFNSKGESLDFGLPKPVILFVGALDGFKRPELAIKAVSKLEEGSLVLVGKGKREEKLQKLGDELLHDRFKILNFSHSEMPSVYRGATLFTFPTVTYESFGIVLVEAMASGIPVVATDDPKRKEIVGNAGMLVDPTDSEAYSKAIKTALNIKWGDKPRNQAEKFDWDGIAKKYEEIFKALVNKK